MVDKATGAPFGVDTTRSIETASGNSRPGGKLCESQLSVHLWPSK